MIFKLFGMTRNARSPSIGSKIGKQATNSQYRLSAATGIGSNRRVFLPSITELLFASNIMGKAFGALSHLGQTAID